MIRGLPSRSWARPLVWLAIVIACATSRAGVVQGASDDRIRVTPLARDGQVYVSFEVLDAFSDDTRDAMQSGLLTTFTYDVELRRPTPMWFDRLVGAVQVTATVKYDNLTRRYHVSVLHDGRVEDSRVTDDERVVRTVLTSFSRLPLFSTDALEANNEYYVVVRARTRPRPGGAWWPWSTHGELFGTAKFTFLP